MKISSKNENETSCSKGKIKLKNCWIFFIKFFFVLVFPRDDRKSEKLRQLFLNLEKFEAELELQFLVFKPPETSKTFQSRLSLYLSYFKC